MSYLGAARTIAQGRAPRVPFASATDRDSTSRLRDYPPGFPAAIALASLGGGSLEQGARLVEIVAAAVTVGGAAFLVASAAAPGAGALAALALLASPAFVGDHSIVLSEPPFLALLVIALGMVAMDAPPALLLGLVCAAAVMVRYAGLSLAGAAALALVLRPGSSRTRALRAAVSAGPAALGFVAWSRWAGGAREYGLKRGFPATLAQGAGTAQTWLAPWLDPGLLRVILSLGVAAALAVVVAKAPRPSAPRPGVRALVRGAALIGACFAALMIFSRLYADDAIVFDDRLLSPLFLLATIAAAAACGEAWSRWPKRTKGLVLMGYAAWLAGTVNLSRALVRDLGDDGWGYASRDWQASELADWLRDEGRSYALFSDNPPAVYSLVHRPSRLVPEAIDSETVAEFADALGERPAAIIGFADPYTPDNPRGGAFAAKLGFREVLRSDEGAVWVALAPGQSSAK